MVRFAYNQLIKWKNNKDSNLLLVGGVNGVGKTHLIKEFANNEYEKKNYYFKSKEDFNIDLDSTSIEKNSLIIIDNLMGDKNALELFHGLSLKNKNLNLILIDSYAKVGKGSGSTLRINYLVIYPLAFEEFLYNIDIELYNELVGLKNVYNINDTLNNKLLNYYRDYLIVGGMPKVISLYSKSGLDFNEIRLLQQKSLDIILNNLKKYFKLNEYKNLIKIINLIFQSLIHDNKKFKLTQISKSIRFVSFQNYFEILKKLNIIYISNYVKPPNYSEDKKSMILYLFDVGFLGLLGDVPLSLYNLETLLTNQISLGLSNNFVATELFSTINMPVYYWSHNMAKVEFLLSNNNKYHPLEIKDDSSGKLKSLKVFNSIQSSEKCSRLNLSKPEIKDMITTYPIYLVKSLYRKFLS